MTTRISTGTTVHSTSIKVLCVVGVGLADARKRTITYSISASTNTEMQVIRISRKWWNSWKRSATGEAAGCIHICQGWGASASAREGASTAHSTVKASPAATLQPVEHLPLITPPNSDRARLRDAASDAATYWRVTAP